MTNSDRSGSIQVNNGRYEIRLERIIEHESATVWRMLTASDALCQWLAPGRIEAEPGGAVRIEFDVSGTTIDTTVAACDPPRLLEYSWSSGDEPERPLRWVLEPVAVGTHLVLTLALPLDEDAAKAAGGWDAHLEMLLAALEGVPIRFPVDIFLEARACYAEQLEASMDNGSRVTG